MSRTPVLTLLPVLLLVVPVVASTQEPAGRRAESPSVCGSMGSWAHLQRSLQSPQGLRWQDEFGVPPLSATDPQGPIRDQEVCSALVQYVREEVEYPLPDPRIYGVYRYGEYYLVGTIALRYDEKGEMTGWRTHTWKFFVFRADSRNFVTQVELPEWPPR